MAEVFKSIDQPSPIQINLIIPMAKEFQVASNPDQNINNFEGHCSNK